MSLSQIHFSTLEPVMDGPLGRESLVTNMSLSQIHFSTLEPVLGGPLGRERRHVNLTTNP